MTEPATAAGPQPRHPDPTGPAKRGKWTGASDDGDMRWWNPASVVREANRRKQAGVCPTCQHPPHRDTTCAVCAGACPYPTTYDAARSRAADARTVFGETLRASIERLFRRRRAV